MHRINKSDNKFLLNQSNQTILKLKLKYCADLFQAKRSAAQTRSVEVSKKAQVMVDNIDALLTYAMDTYGPEACRQPIL